MRKQQLFYGDNLEVMRKHIPDETVDLCYIDPPFNSKRNYNQIYNNIGKEDKAQCIAFVDTWEWNARAEKEYDEICGNEKGIFAKQTADLIMGLHTILGRGSLLSYLISMTLRINEIHRVLKPTGSFYLHCDPTASHYLKLVLDAVFCSRKGSFINELVWFYKTGGASKNTWAKKHDVIFFYSKNKTKYTFNPIKEKSYMMHKYGFKKSDFKIDPDTGLQYTMVYCRDVWDLASIGSASAERLGYPTQKPEALLERIIKASSNEGDVVLDAYCGCGTTVAAAQKLSRQWIGIDISYQSISLIMKRLTDSHGTDIMSGITVSGIPADIESAKALAAKSDDRLRKEFEKWAVLTYSDNRAMINAKKGKDYGIDGVVRIPIRKNQYGDILFSVKSGSNVNSGMIRDFRGAIAREDAAAGIFITLKEPTKDMRREAAAAGFYRNEHMRDIEKIKIVTVEKILAGERLNMVSAADVLKKAPSDILAIDNQLTFAY